MLWRYLNMPHSWETDLAQKLKFLTVVEKFMTKNKALEKPKPKPTGHKVWLFPFQFHFSNPFNFIFFFSKYFCHQELKQGAILAEIQGSTSKEGLSKSNIWLFFPFQSNYFYFISNLSSSKFSGWIFISNRLIRGFKWKWKSKVCLFLNRK